MNICLSILFVLVVVASSPSMARPKEGQCDKCVFYDFESDYETLFTHEGACLDLSRWTEGKYSDIDTVTPNWITESFIRPYSDLSCTTSFPFEMAGGGTVFVKIYINSTTTENLDQVYVLAEEITEGNNPTMGMGIRSNTDVDFLNGWSVISFPIFGFTTFQGHLVFMGLTNEESTVIVDSFCYKPRGQTGNCWEDESTEEEIEATPEPTTPEPATPEPTTPEPTTPEPATPEPTTYEPTTKEPTNETTVTEGATEQETAETGQTDVTTNKPNPTFSTPPPGYDKCPVDPYFHWLLPHETDCTLFYSCVWGEKVLRECKDGLHFNRMIQVCDWPWNAGCQN